MDSRYSLQDVIRCHLCETPDPSKHCDNCHIHLCEGCVEDHLSDKSKEHYIVPFKTWGQLLQDVIRCDLCETPVPSKHCEICRRHLCEACVGDHLSDKSKEHYIVPFKIRGKIPRCQEHSLTACTELCKKCHIPICKLCVASNKHNKHEKEDILTVFKSKIELMEKDLKVLEKHVYPKYQETTANIQIKRDDVGLHYQDTKKALREQGKALHTEIDTIIQRMCSKIDAMDAQHREAIDKEEAAIKYTLNEITQTILEIKELLDTSDVHLVTKYKSRVEEFETLPSQFEVILPTFTPQEISNEQIYEQLGSLSELIITYQLIDKPIILTEIQTDYEGWTKGLFRVSHLGDNELWTCGRDKTLKLYNLKGELLRSIQTMSGNMSLDIAVTRYGDLVYVDHSNRSVILVSNTHVHPLIRLRGWRPRGVCTCSASTGTILVAMDSDNEKETKIVRYSDSTEKQSIQWDNKGKPLYLPSPYTKYLSENRNLDICVADYSAGAIVVVNVDGNLRFKYTGPSSTANRLFKPFGVTTDSQGKILTAEEYNGCIHVLDKDGHLLRYINNCNLQNPRVFCVDSKDNLIVGEFRTGKVKIIQCYK